MNSINTNQPASFTNDMASKVQLQKSKPTEMESSESSANTQMNTMSSSAVETTGKGGLLNITA
ncbi:MAG: hypothetical protein CJD30_08085 [Sulfuricurvum sp. PD_MW2]|uniref:hypothetical protein n=1 Tax=Sulfuricurvum sp. PD_MW2 TaxID=2027917 RepID=UPI000C065F8F|nr:hypothetical protein [Sulfuricurvum sp. PD_MW2]PHM17142.1 MAG: hypothetical protein CJD30_08085 [Sulfuricurvum sp. PD_MW2]